MLNYTIDPDSLIGYVPAGTELDTWNGSHFVSLIGFQFLDTRVKGIPIPFHRNFEEINLRFYVKSKSTDGWRRGVVFVKEIVPKRAIATVARSLYNENYVVHATDSKVYDRVESMDGHAEYSWRHGNKWLRIGGAYSGDSSYPESGSHEEFISEHYWGYTAQRDGGTIEYKVDHPQWSVWPILEPIASEGLGEFYGSNFRDTLASAPFSSFVANGSDIVVRRGSRIDRRNS